VQDNGEHWGEAELHRIRGQLLLVRGMHEAQQAEACFRTALDVACRQHARSYQLRAAIDLAALWNRQRRSAEATATLSEALGVWPDDLDTPDLRQARQAMQELVHGSSIGQTP